MPFLEFLSLCRVYRMLYGYDKAKDFFDKNIGLYYNLDNLSNNKHRESETTP